MTVTAVDNEVDAADTKVTVSGRVSSFRGSEEPACPEGLQKTPEECDQQEPRVTLERIDPEVTAPSEVTLTIIDNDASPVFAGATDTSREVAENTAAGTAIGAAFRATDADYDEVRYTLAGSDAASFAIGEQSGVLAVRAALDHETKASYAVTVRAADEHGNATDLAVTIAVTDLDEPPAAPTGLAVATRSTTELRATWTAPGTTGRPAITGYDVRYRQGTSGTWIYHAHGGTTTTADIGSLLAGTSYQVRVRAVNAEDNGAWTSPASGTTMTVEQQRATQPAGVTLPWDFPLTPDRLPVGQSYRLMFVTSDGMDAEDAAVGPYNAHVQSAAARNWALQAFSGGFRAMVQPGNAEHHLRSNTRTRATDPGAAAPIYWVNGAKVADGYADLYDGSWNSTGSSEPTDEHGAALRRRVEVWTGSRADGTDWVGRQVADASTMVGLPHAPGKELGGATARPATERKPLYAISPVITVRAAVGPTQVHGDGVKLSVREWSILVLWPEPQSFECGYLVEWKKQGEEYDPQSRSVEISSFGPYRATIGVEPGTTYTVRVSRRYSDIGGTDTVLAELTVTTQGTAPGGGLQQAPGDTAAVAAAELEPAWARVWGSELALRFDTELDETSVPPAGAFAVAAAGAICTADGQPLDEPFAVTVPGPPGSAWRTRRPRRAGRTASTSR